MNKKEAAAYLRLSTRAVERAVARGKLSPRYRKDRRGHVAVFDPSEVRRYKADVDTPFPKGPSVVPPVPATPKRYSHGLDLTAAFTWQKELVRGAGGNPGLGGSFVNNVFNREAQKSLASTSTPFIFVTGFSYTTPRVGPNRVVEQLLGNWTVGGLLRYASGAFIHAPSSTNNLFPLLFQSTLQNRVPGQPLFLKDPNCGCIDPRRDQVLNPAAWVDAPPGQFSNSSGYFNDYRWQRQVTENMSLGRRFPIKEKIAFEVRAEFFNIFNRLYLAPPASGNPTAAVTRNSAGELTGGFGFVNHNANPPDGSRPRTGQLVARFEF